jgi:hypothetical protein
MVPRQFFVALALVLIGAASALPLMNQGQLPGATDLRSLLGV